ncbi:MAG: alpha/beta hydrolase fold domain-containing protein [Proteobacteria bacterium]|nr:alpha/beta hydrolase fold domain-containing protein [Pseudomonadota bacterium]
MSWLLAIFGLLCLAVALSGLWPPRNPAWLRMPGFFAGWLASELPLHGLAVAVLGCAALSAGGGLDAWPGRLGLGACGVAGLIGIDLARRQRGAGEVLEAGLVEGLGEDYRASISADWAAALDEPIEAARVLFPLGFRDPRVERISDLAYGPHGERNQLDLYRPAAGARDCPVLLQVHGGAWTYGQKEHQALPLLYHLAAHGWVCVSANYRLSPAATFPEHLIDVKRAIAWIREHGPEYGADPSYIAVTGGSAGGHLAALAALTPGDPEYQPGFENVDTSLQACIPFYAPFDLVDRHSIQNDDGMERLIAEQFLKRPLAEASDAWERGSPIARLHPGAPPFFVVHGALDSLAYVEGTHHFLEAFRASGAPSLAYAELPGAQHAFEVFNGLRGQHSARAVLRYLAYQLSVARAAAPTAAGTGAC